MSRREADTQCFRNPRGYGPGNCRDDETASKMEQNREAKESRGDTIRTCDLYVPNVAL